MQNLTIMPGNIASPKNAHDLPVRYAHKKQWQGVQKNQLDNREGSLTLWTPRPYTLGE